ALFGTADKVALLVGIGLVLVAVAGAVGVIATRRPIVARAVIVAGAIAGIAAAVTRAGASMVDALPSLAAMIAAVAVLGPLVRRLPASAADDDETPPGTGANRRTFL